MQDFLNVYELSKVNYVMTNNSLYVEQQQTDDVTITTSGEHERKALNAFICWSILMNRYQLTRALWKYCETPLPMALFISAMYASLSTYCYDEAELERQVQSNAQYFSSAAVELLDLAFRDNEAKAFDALGEMFQDFNNLTPLQIAFGARDRHFLGHTACQRWLTDAFWGGLALRTIDFPFPFTLPQSIKVLSSAIFFLPSFLWLQIKAKPKETRALFGNAVRGTIVAQHHHHRQRQQEHDSKKCSTGDLEKNEETVVVIRAGASAKLRRSSAESEEQDALGANVSRKSVRKTHTNSSRTSPLESSSCSSSTSSSSDDAWNDVECLPSSYTDLSRTAPQDVQIWQRKVLVAQQRTRRNRRFYNFLCWPYRNNNKRRDRHVTLVQRYVMIWTAPVSKFYIYQLLWWIALVLLSVQSSGANCLHGSPIDLVVLIFGISFLLEYMEQRIREKQVRLKLSMFRYLDFVTFFFVPVISYLLYTLESSQAWPPFDDYTLRIINGYIALYYFYRYIFIFYAIDRRLGPMLVRIDYMVTHDLSAWFKMVIPPLIGSSILIQSSFYPNWRVWQSDWFAAIALRGVLSMFALQADNIRMPTIAPDDSCKVALSSPVLNKGICWLENQNRTAPCPMQNAPSTIAILQFLLFGNFIMSTLLYAMFYGTYDKITPDSENIWRYEYYRTVVGFACHSSVPPPFNLLRYFYLIIKYICQLLQRYCCCHCRWFRQRQHFSQNIVVEVEPPRQDTLLLPTVFMHKSSVPTQRTVIAEQELTYWMQLARDLHNERESRRGHHGTLASSGGGGSAVHDAADSGRADVTSAGTSSGVTSDASAANSSREAARRISIVLEALDANAAFNARLRDRMLALEKITNGSRVYLESIKHQLDKQDVSGVVSRKGRLLHIQSRTSPYPGTTVGRFHVFDKHVPWERPYDVYDPPTYVLPREAFRENERDFVDPEIDLVAQQQQQQQREQENQEAEQNHELLLIPDNRKSLEKPDYVGDETIPAVQPAAAPPKAFAGAGAAAAAGHQHESSTASVARQVQRRNSFQAALVTASAGTAAAAVVATAAVINEDDVESEDDEDDDKDDSSEDDEDEVVSAAPQILSETEQVVTEEEESAIRSNKTSSIYMASINFGLMPPANNWTASTSNKALLSKQKRRESKRKNLTLDYAKAHQRRIKRQPQLETNSILQFSPVLAETATNNPAEENNTASKDLLALAERRRSRRPTVVELQLDEREQFQTDTRRNFLFNWNTATKSDDSSSTLDRRSWIVARDGQGLIYRINALGRPMNPMGRTGLTGRGALPRYGPNHAVYLIVTRIHEQQQTVDAEQIRRIVQVLAVRCDEADEQQTSSVCSLPMSYVFGTEPVLVVACRLLTSLIEVETEADKSEQSFSWSNSAQLLKNSKNSSFVARNFSHEVIVIDSSVENSEHFTTGKKSDVIATRNSDSSIEDVDDEIKMVKFIDNYLFPRPRTPKFEQRLKFEQQQQFHAQEELTFKGYSDDPRNTDNAWLEVMAFSVHLTSGGGSSQLDELDKRLASSVKWKDVNASLKMFGNELAFVEQVCSQLDIPLR